MPDVKKQFQPPQEETAKASETSSTLKHRTNHQAKKKAPRLFNPLAFYRRVLSRLFLLYRHVLGLMVGGLIAYVDQLPPYKRKFFRSAFSRITAFFLRPFIKKDIGKKPFEEQLRLRLEMLGPTYIKLGQIMAIREDILPKNITDELKQLLDRLPEVPFHIIREIIEESLGASIDALFHAIDEKPIGSASIGQTHLATLKNGETVVLKIIKPGIRETILYDIQLLQILSNILEWIIPRYQPKVIINEFCAYTEKEIDLTYEADHAELFAANYADDPNVVFPKIYRKLSTSEVLCMEYLSGMKPNDPSVFGLSQEDQEKVIDTGAGAIIKMLFEDGFFHADLHAGNIIILPGPKIGFIDLGMVGRFEEKTRLNMLYYFYSLVNNDIESTVKYLLAMAETAPGGDAEGFKRSVSDLFRRFRLQAAYGSFSLGELILESLTIAGRYRIFFPVEMTLMVKALVTYEGVGQFLRPNLNIPELSRKHIQVVYTRHYSPKKLAQRFLRGLPEFVDVIVRLPQLMSSSTRFLEKVIHDPPQEDPFPGLRSGLIAGACIIGGVIALVQGANPFLWIGLFAIAIFLAFLGK